MLCYSISTDIVLIISYYGVLTRAPMNLGGVEGADSGPAQASRSAVARLGLATPEAGLGSGLAGATRPPKR